MIGLTQIEFMNVIKTLPSNGNLLAAILDDLKLPEVVGTLAGHDTILVISPNADVAQQLNEEIAKNMNPDIVH